MKSTPSSARWIARSVFVAVCPTYSPTRPARSTSTRWPFRSSPIARYIWASRRAIVVLPVPGLPRKTRCWLVATSGSPCSSRFACTCRNATSARTCSLTVSGTAYALQQTMVVPALPAFQRELHTTTTWATWVLTVLLLVASVATPVLGKLGDQYGKERLLVIALSVFLVGSVIAACAWN